MTTKRMTTSEARATWRETLRHVENGGTVVLMHYNRPIAQITPITQELAMTVTLNDIIEQVGVAVSANDPAHAEGIDIQAVAEEIRDTYGLISIDATDGEDGDPLIPFDEFWAIVAKHDAKLNEA